MSNNYCKFIILSIINVLQIFIFHNFPLCLHILSHPTVIKQELFLPSLTLKPNICAKSMNCFQASELQCKTQLQNQTGQVPLTQLRNVVPQKNHCTVQVCMKYIFQYHKWNKVLKHKKIFILPCYHSQRQKIQ